MKRVFLIVIVMATMFAAGGCKASKHSVSDQTERFESDRRQFLTIFDAEVNR